MRRIMVAAAGLAFTGALTGCQKQADTMAPAPSSTMTLGNMTGMPKAGAMKHGQATGTVTAIDAAKGTVTLDHGPMMGLDWPPMKMAFSATPAQLARLKIGDKVDFEIDWDGKAGSVTKVSTAK